MGTGSTKKRQGGKNWQEMESFTPDEKFSKRAAGAVAGMFE